jgi:hypothetical protein
MIEFLGGNANMMGPRRRAAMVVSVATATQR